MKYTPGNHGSLVGPESHLLHVVPGIQGLSVIHGILNVLFVVAQLFFFNICTFILFFWRQYTYCQIFWYWSFSNSATWCEELTHWKRSWRWKDWGQEEKGATVDEMGGLHHWLNGHEIMQTHVWEIVKNREAWGAAVHGLAKSWTWLNDWTTTTTNNCFTMLH